MPRIATIGKAARRMSSTIGTRLSMSHSPASASQPPASEIMLENGFPL